MSGGIGGVKKQPFGRPQPQPEADPQPDRSAVRFVIVLPDQKWFALSEGESKMVGRDNGYPSLDLDNHVSHDHAELDVEHGDLWVSDHGSTGKGSVNGTFVVIPGGTKRVPVGAKVQVEHGAILLGKVQLLVRREHG